MQIGTIRTQNIPSSGLCLGGVGCGGIELWPDGTFRHVAIANSRPWAGGREGHNYAMDVGDAPDEPLFHPEDICAILRVRVGEGKPQLRFLMRGHGVSFTSNGNMSRLYKYAVVPAVDAIEYEATFPFVTLRYEDAKLPVRVSLTAWTPFVPHDHEVSATPGVVLDYAIENLGDEPVEVSLLFSCRNYAGFDGEAAKQEHEVLRGSGHAIVRMRGDLDRPQAQASGCLSAFCAPSSEQQVSLIESNPYLENIFWPFFLGGDLDGELIPDFLQRVEYCTPTEGSGGHGVKKSYLHNQAWIACKQQLAGRVDTRMRYGIAWYFPNHYDVAGTRVGKAYERRFADSAAVARWLIDHGDELAARSRRYVDAVLDSSLEPRFALSLLDQHATLAKATWLSSDERLFVWEGLGCCCMNTVDVDHYGSFGPAHLFPQWRRSVAESVRAVQLDNGQIVHGFPMQIEGPITEKEYRRWDVNLQYLLAVYRDWKWSGEEDFLATHYQPAVAAFDFVTGLDKYGVGLPYIEGGITYDHWHMKGVVTYMANLFLTAAHALERMAVHRGDEATAERVSGIREQGQRHLDELLWNEELGRYNLYYYRKEGAEDEPGKVAHEKGAIAGDLGDFDPEAIRSQRAGCDPATGCCPPADPVHGEVRDDGLQTDALNGEAYAAIVGLPRSLPAERTRATLRAIWAANHDPDLQFVANGSYADGSFPDQWPFSQWQNPWTGSEYYFAAQLLAEGMLAEGLQVITDVYDRYVREGMRFNHIECNTHYSRAMSIYAAYDAWLGLDWDQPAGRLRLLPAEWQDGFRAPLITPACWGSLRYAAGELQLELASGRGRLERIELPAQPGVTQVTVLHDGEELAAELTAVDSGLGVQLGSAVVLASGQSLVLRLA